MRAQNTPVAQVSEIHGKRCVTFCSYKALWETPLWTKLYAAPPKTANLLRALIALRDAAVTSFETAAFQGALNDAIADADAAIVDTQSAPSARLSEEQIDKIRFGIRTKAVTQRDHELARAIEAAHGISDAAVPPQSADDKTHE